MSQVGGAWDDPRVRFWTKEADFYRDSSEWVFLARAVRAVGAALFPGEWTGAEPGTPWYSPLPQQFDGYQRSLVQAQLLLLVHHAPYRDRCKTDTIFMPLPTAEEWTVAYRISVEQAEVIGPSFDRFVSAIFTLVRLFEAGVLLTGIREIRGGNITPLHPSYWNGESVISRFRCCRIHAADPFTWETVDKGGFLLFVKRADLDKYLTNRSSRQVQSASGGLDNANDVPLFYQSPFMRVVNQVAVAIKLDPDNPPKDDVLKEHLRSVWPADLPALSANMLTAMAKMMRSPQAQKGGAKRQQKRG